MLRRTTPMIIGGIWKTALSIYQDLPERYKPKIREKALEFVWPSGAKQKYMHMERVNDKYNIQGHEYTFIGFDEAHQFEWEQIEYAMSRLRSRSKHKSRMVLTCNPVPEGKLRELVDWYLDEEGYPHPDRDGKVRWFITVDGEFMWANTPEELKKNFGDKVNPLSFQFISATIYDNPFVLESNPGYVAYLEGMNPVEKAQLLWGCWNAKPLTSNYFKREFLKDTDKVPLNSTSVRAWDKAGKERTISYKNPDFTASCKMHKCRDGFYYITGDHHPDNYDDVTETGGRFCKSVGERDMTIRRQAEYDGVDTTVIFSVDPGQSGLSEFQNSAKPLVETGYKVKKDPTPGNKSKLKRFEPFASAAEQGFVRIVRSTFSAKTYEAFMKEMEVFDGERSTTYRHDDWVDAVASAFNFLASGKVHTPLAMPDYSCPTKLSQF